MVKYIKNKETQKTKIFGYRIPKYLEEAFNKEEIKSKTITLALTEYFIKHGKMKEPTWKDFI